LSDVLVVAGVYKTYPGGVRALRGVDLRIRRGELVGLVGANGSGKTTLIKVALGILSRDRGQVLLNGRDPFRDPEAREGVGVVFERPNLPSGMSVRRLLESVAKLYGVPRDYVDEAIAIAGLEGHEHKTFAQLSAGLKQRAAIAHALISQPDFIIADEPTSNLDPIERVRILEVLAGLNSKGITLLITSHVIHEVVRTATRIVVMREGRIVKDGGVEEVLSSSKARVRARSPEVLVRVLADHGFEAETLGASIYVVHNGRWRELLEALAKAEAAGAGIVSFDAVEPGLEEVLS
jgi:ABC-2 type transport system ATP-binding protein